MDLPTRSRHALILAAVLALLGVPAAGQFRDDFNAPALDPAWTVVQTWPGGVARAHGFTNPGNRYSLTDNPGFLRYALDPMTHFDGFLNGYATTFSQHSCCNHDAGLEIHRTFSGDRWRFEARGNFHLPFTNGRSFTARIYFGTGAVPTYWVSLSRGADVHHNSVALGLFEKTGPNLADQTTLQLLQPNGNWYYGAFQYPKAPLFFRLDRAGGLLNAYWSDDGTVWNAAWSHDLGGALDGLEQRVVLTGLSWFNTGGSYADWDYVAVTPTVLPVAIDIKPGTDPNSINPRSNGTIPVAILTTSRAAGEEIDFDAQQVDRSTVAFGPNAASLIRASLEDADADGDLDLVAHFRTVETGIACSDTKATLTGKTTAGRVIEGKDSINTVSCR